MWQYYSRMSKKCWITSTSLCWYKFGIPFIVEIYVISDPSTNCDITGLDIINVTLYNMVKNFPFWMFGNNKVLKDDNLSNTIVKKFYLFCIQDLESHGIKYNELLVEWDIYYTSRR